jgi:hypothetical protein
LKNRRLRSLKCERETGRRNWRKKTAARNTTLYSMEIGKLVVLKASRHCLLVLLAKIGC